MDFRTFAEPLINLAYPDLSKGDAVKELFIDATSYDEADDNPLRDIEDSTYRGYLKKGKGVSRVAGIALKRLDTDKFAAMINSLPTDVINMLIDAYEEEIPGVNSLDIGEQLAAQFATILKDAKSGKHGKAEAETKPDIAPSAELGAELYVEANGKCPLCGASIASEGSARRYKIVGITPSIAKKDYREKRKYENMVPQMPALGSAEDRIALCLDCAHRYESDQSPEAFTALVSRKRELRARNDLTTEISSLDLEKNLPVLLAQLGQIQDYEELEKLPLKALKVKQKINADEQFLIFKIEALSTQFYNLVKEQAQILEQQGILDFDLLATQIRHCYLKLRKSELSQEQIFTRICNWIALKTGSDRQGECEVLAAFFVQNCEVFDEIAE